MAQTRTGAQRRRGAALGALAFLLAGVAVPAAEAADPVKRIAIYVDPFYRAGATPEEAPVVGTGNPHAPLLASTKSEDVMAARDLVIANPALVTPMTMMVLAIRLYDIGKRDDAAFWFYAAMDRYFTLAEVAQPGAPILVISNEAMRAFVALVGPYVNGYAFCDLDRQRDIRAKALAWVEAHPYEAIFSEKIPARSADRKAALAAALASAKEAFEKERAYLANKDNVAKLKEDRQKNEMDAKFCWK